MKRRKNKKSGANPLRKRLDIPMAEVRVMQITSSTTIPFAPVTVSTGASATQSSASSGNSDQAELNMSSATFDSLVKEASSFPEVRSEVVDAYAAQVATGHYPPVDVISGLADLLSGSGN
jgi:hypothetical protein